MSEPVTPPVEALPVGAVKWSTVNEVAIRTKKDLRTVRGWVAHQLVHIFDLVGGYGGLWIAAYACDYPLTNAAGVAAYRERRRAAARKGALLGSAKAASIRKTRRAAPSSKPTRRARSTS